MRWKAKNYNDWHAHFMWLPKKVNGEWVWLERVLRRGRPNMSIDRAAKWRWEYVNSEFDLIVQSGEKRDIAESAVTQGLMVGQGLIQQYKPQIHPEQ